MQFGIKVNHLHESVDAGIGTPRAQRVHRMCREARQGVLQVVLHSPPRRLTLPALVPLPKVADAECQSHRMRAPAECGMTASAEVGEEALCLGLERPGGPCHDFLDECARSISVTNGVKLLGQCQLGRHRILIRISGLGGV